ncbi:MAG: hypothetical protein ACE5JQ_12690 [Candidatus Methylomirabilales bacterium]
MITSRADAVGSLLRPPWLLKAQQDLTTGTITPSAYKALEDQAVDEAVALQEEAGLEVVTDGEMRRQSFQSQMTAAVDGFGECPPEAFLWGDWHGGEEVGDMQLERPASLGAIKKLSGRRHLSAEEFSYLRARTTRIPKITIPSPSLWANFWSPEHSREVYPTLDHFLADVTEILRDEVVELVRRGATYIQLDAPHYALLVDPKTRAFYESQGWSLDRWLQQGVEMDNVVMGDFPEVTFGFHL